MYTNRFFSFLVMMALVGVLTLTIQEAVATKAVAFAPELGEAQRERIRAAEAARWTAMGEYYEHLDVAKRQRSRKADTARWMGQAEYYQNFEEAHKTHRGRAADTVRWTAMAEYYAQLIKTTR